MIVHVRRGPAPERKTPAIWVLDALHQNLGGQLQGVMDNDHLEKFDVRMGIELEEVRRKIQGMDVHFVHTGLKPTLPKFGPRSWTKHRALKGKFIPGDTVIIIPAVGKDGGWVKGDASKSRPTKVVREVVAYSFKVVARRVR